MNDHQIYHESDLLTFALVGIKTVVKPHYSINLQVQINMLVTFQELLLIVKMVLIKAIKIPLLRIYQVFIQCHLIVVKKSSQGTSY